MKLILYIVLLSIPLFSFSQQHIPYHTVETAFEINDANRIVQIVNDQALISINGKEKVYSKAQAKLVLQNFFVRKPKGTFTFLFKGKETKDGAFCVGKYKTRKEEFRVTVHFKKVKGHYKIESILIEKNE